MTESKTTKIKFTSSQHEAIVSNERMLAITAGAGSGKTSVLIERVIECIRTRDVPLSKILAITFTDKAASELKHKLIKALGDPIAVSTGYISTFHSFCTRLLREGAPLLGLDPDFGVLDEGSSKIILRKAVKTQLLKLLASGDADIATLFDELELREVEELMEELISYRWHAEKLASVMSGDSIKQAALSCFEKIKKAYDAEKGDNLDFNDLEILTLKLLELDEVRERYQERFKYIFIDEFQDVNDTQAMLVARLFNPAKNHITFVGDPKQSIYRFRGANVAQFNKAFDKAGHKVVLKENWRSAKGIIEFVNAAFDAFDPLVAGLDNVDADVVKLSIESPPKSNAEQMRVAEAKAIAEFISDIHGRGDIACLFASLSSLEIYCRELAARKIPYVVFGGFGFFELDEIIDILSLLKAASDRTDIISLLAACRSAFINMTDEEIYLAFRQPKDHLTLPPRVSEISEAVWRHKKTAILSQVEKAARELTCSELILKFAKKPLSDNAAKLISIAASLEERDKIGLKDFISYCDDIRKRSSRVAEYPEAKDGAVKIMTVHKAKGLEFDNVILCDLLRVPPNDTEKWRFIRGGNPDIEFKFLPDENAAGENETTDEFERLDEINKEEEKLERERLLYVALTRAKGRLVIPLHANVKRTGEWHKRMESLFSNFPAHRVVEKKYSAEELECIDDAAPTKDDPNISSVAPIEANRFSSKTVYTTSEIEAYARCPMEYYLKYDLCVPAQSLSVKSESEKLPANVRGDIVHRMIEVASKILPAKLDRTRLLESAICEHNVKPGKSDRESMLEQFERFAESPYLSFAKRMNEVPFLLKIKNKVVNGKLDMMTIDDKQNWEIIDFKTGDGRTDPKEAVKKYDLQIRTYGAAIANSAKFARTGKVTLLFLSNKSAIPVSSMIDEVAVERTKRELSDMIKGIETGDFKVRTDPPCKTCAFNLNKTCWERRC